MYASYGSRGTNICHYYFGSKKRSGSSISYGKIRFRPFINYELYSLQVMDQQDTLNIHLGDLDITSEDFWLDEVDGMHVKNKSPRWRPLLINIIIFFVYC